MVGQNTSHAVMSQRIEPHDSREDFPTPPWATRLFLQYAFTQRWMDEHDLVLEPAANRGHMVEPLREYFSFRHDRVTAFDIHDYGAGFPVEDFLFHDGVYDWVITNPPFRLAQQFIEHAWARTRVGVAVLVRIQILETHGRYRDLFAKHPPSEICQYVERVPIYKGRLAPEDRNTATAYCWLLWRKDARIDGPRPPHFHWLPPGRKSFERAEDYPVVDVDIAPAPLLENSDYEG